MKLNFNQIKQITIGAVDIKEENGVVSFSRFTDEQKNVYLNHSKPFYDRTQATAGIKLYFRTNSKNLFIKVGTSFSTERTFFSMDVFVNKCPIGYIDNFSEMELTRDYVQEEYLLGEASKNFMLGDGEKTVCVYFPYTVKAVIKEISIDDDAFVEGIKPKKKLMMFGDSITQGHDALRPSNCYTPQIAEMLEAEEFNKGMSGGTYFPELAELKDSFVPDYITVAYGTNDWGCREEETFKSKCNAFYSNLSKNYPHAKIFAITPIWRKDKDECKEIGPFEIMAQHIREIAEKYKNVTVIFGQDLVPEDENFFADFVLHPNDDGFKHYVKNLYDKIKTEI